MFKWDLLKYKVKQAQQNNMLETEQLSRLISGALVDTIKTHGPITRSRSIPSAAKRIAGQIRGYLLNITQQNIQDEVRKEKDLLIEHQKKEIISLQKQRDDLLKRCGIK